MRIIPLILVFLHLSLSNKSQTFQISIGSTGAQYFYDNKIDPTGRSTVNVGYTNNAGTANDVFIVKLNSSNQILWQKTILNAGDDFFDKVIICANGDYVVAGQIFLGGVRRGVVCRFNSANGDLIWASTSANSAVGEVFYDVKETTNQDIALAGYENFSPSLTNSFVVLLNSAGTRLWSYISTRPNSDGFQTIAQLPNGNLLAGGIYIETAGKYDAVLMELNQTTGAIVSQTVYPVSTSVPGLSLTLNSLAPRNIFIRDNKVILQLWLYQGFGSDFINCIMTYDLVTKNMSGVIPYHFGSGTVNGFSVYPLTETDYLLGSSYLSPPGAYVSRITDGLIVFNRKVNGLVNSLDALDVWNTSTMYAGSASGSALDGFNLLSNTSIPTTSGPCDIANSSGFFLQPLSTPSTASNALIMIPGGAMVAYIPTFQTTTFSATNICGIIPVKLTEFTGVFKHETESNLLNWYTSSEFNSKIFFVEKSINGGQDFSEIGTVNAAGTSNVLLKYEFIDLNPYNGINFYRLKQVDMDGKIQYSKIISIDARRKSNSIYSVYPVPARSFTFVRSSETTVEPVDILIVDAQGKIVSRKKAMLSNAQPVKLELNSIAPGLYYVKLLSTKNKTTTIKLLIK